MNKILLAFAFLFCLSTPALAQLGGTDIKPGDSCTAAQEGHVARNASADRDISEITLICDGSEWQSATGNGGLAALQGQNDTGPCTLEKDGLIRYRTSGDPKWEYCDGGTTSWLPFRLPQCQDDDAGACTLSMLRSSDDPQFTAANIRCGSELLGVTGTYGSGSSNAFNFTDVTNAALTTLTTASAVTISGIPAGCPGEVFVSGLGSPQVSINGGPWGTTGSISNGESLAVRLTSSASFSTAHTATISIGSTEEQWSVTTLGADTTPNAFTFTDVTGAALSTLTTSNAITIGGINTATPVSVSGAGAQISINGGSWVTSGTITNGQTLEVRLTSSGSFSTAISATIDVGGVTDSWSVTTLGADTTPNAFTFTDATNANPSTLTASNSVTISGINTATAVSATGGAQFRINGGSWVTSGTITNGQTLEVRLTSSASFSTAVSTTVTVGSVTDTWSATTRAPNSCSAASQTWLTNCTATASAAAHGANGTATITNPGGCGTAYYGSGTFACSDGSFTYSTGSCTQQTACDTTPNAFTFADVTGANPSTLTTATSVTISGINTSTPVSVTGTGATISINGGSWVTSGTITSGQTLAVRLTSSASFSTAMSATVDVGGVTDSWSVTTRAAASCTAASQTWLTNCTATASAAAHGANGTATITNPGGCGTAYYGSGTFACSDGSFTYSTGSCTQQTACDTTPNSFTFADVTGANPGTLTTATAVTISGINTSTPVSVTGTGATISINGGGWVTSGTITSGQTLAVRLTSSASFSTAMSATVNVGGVTDSWSVTTRAANNCTVTSGTAWTVSSSTCTAPSNVNINHGATGTSTDATAPTTGAKTFSCTDGTLATSGTPTCTTASGCSTHANCSSGGKCVGGYCWYQTSAYTESCNSYCASRGGCNTAGTVNYAGSAGSQANCSLVLKAFYGSSMAAANYGNPGWGGWGCGAGSDAYSGGTYGIWASSPTTTCATTNQAAIDSYGGYGGAGRVCACNN